MRHLFLLAVFTLLVGTLLWAGTLNVIADNFMTRIHKNFLYKLRFHV